jgi:hypothetical protein
MAAITEETGARLLAALEAQQQKQQPPPAQQAMPAPAQSLGMNGFGMPGILPMMPAATMQPQVGFVQPQLQPSGISVTVNYSMPDGSQLPVSLHFGAECAQNLPAFVQTVGAMFGAALKTWTPRQAFNGPGGNGGWHGGGYGYYQGRGRRW